MWHNYRCLTRAVMDNVSKKGEKYGRYYYLKYFYWVVFNRTLSMYDINCVKVSKVTRQLRLWLVCTSFLLRLPPGHFITKISVFLQYIVPYHKDVLFKKEFVKRITFIYYQLGDNLSSTFNVHYKSGHGQVVKRSNH